LVIIIKKAARVLKQKADSVLKQKVRPAIGRLVDSLVMRGFCADAAADNDFIKDRFIERCRSMESPRVLELGAKRAVPTRSTRKDEWIPHAGQYLGTDIEEDEDVDFVADVHRLTRTTGEEQFDAIISRASFEHFKYPFLAAHEIMKALRIGGVLYVWTVQTFPIHHFACDYFRFSQEALAALFGTQMGFRVLDTNYNWPAKIYAPRVPDCQIHPSFLGVELFGEKIDKTPDTYVYEYDSK
jgi:SAM-dependent methyltransferase